MSRFNNTHRSLLAVIAFATIAAAHPVPVTAQIVGTPGAQSASPGPRLPAQWSPARTVLPGERSEMRTRVASGATIHLSTLAIVLGVVILLILLV